MYKEKQLSLISLVSIYSAFPPSSAFILSLLSISPHDHSFVLLPSSLSLYTRVCSRSPFHPLLFITARPVRSSSPAQTAARQSFGPRSSAPPAPEFSSTWLDPSRSWRSRCPRPPTSLCHWCSRCLRCNGSDKPGGARQKRRAGPVAQSAPCTRSWWGRDLGHDQTDKSATRQNQKEKIRGTDTSASTHMGCLSYMTGRNSSTGSVLLRGSALRSFRAPCSDNM